MNRAATAICLTCGRGISKGATWCNGCGALLPLSSGLRGFRQRTMTCVLGAILLGIAAFMGVALAEFYRGEPEGGGLIALWLTGLVGLPSAMGGGALALATGLPLGTLRARVAPVGYWCLAWLISITTIGVLLSVPALARGLKE